MKLEFTQHIDMWGWLKRLGLTSAFADRDEAYRLQIELCEGRGDMFGWRQARLEEDWAKVQRPYYTVYPAILPLLLKIKLDLPCNAIRPLAIQPVELRLPMGGENDPFAWVDEERKTKHRVLSVLFGTQEMPSSVGSDELIPGFVLACDVGDRMEMGLPLYMFKQFPLVQDSTVEQADKLLTKHASWDVGVRVPIEIEQALIKLVCCVALLDNDPDLIQPDVLTADEGKFVNASEAERLALIERARRRGKVGWSIGKNIEVIPHLRRPHPALVWTGQGRTTPRIVLRRGSVVHRSRLSEIPTGFSDEV